MLDIASLVAVAGKQPGCACPADQICLSDLRCREAPLLHPPLIPNNTIRGGWCQVAGPGPARAATPPWILALLVLSGLLLRRTPRARRRTPTATPRTHAYRPA
jgi:MYXO-CTERM domain-containing protein